MMNFIKNMDIRRKNNMGWTSNEPVNIKKGIDKSSKILLGIIACIIFIIVFIFILMVYVKETSFSIIVDGEEVTTVSKNNLFDTVEGITYINIKEFAKLVGYEYHCPKGGQVWLFYP